MGFRLVAQDGNRYRYAVDSGRTGGPGGRVEAPKERQGRVLVGTRAPHRVADAG